MPDLSLAGLSPNNSEGAQSASWRALMLALVEVALDRRQAQADQAVALRRYAQLGRHVPLGGAPHDASQRRLQHRQQPRTSCSSTEQVRHDTQINGEHPDQQPSTGQQCRSPPQSGAAEKGKWPPLQEVGCAPAALPASYGRWMARVHQ